MTVHRDLLLPFVMLGIAATLYFLSFRDLAAAQPVTIGTSPGVTLIPLHDAAPRFPAAAG